MNDKVSNREEVITNKVNELFSIIRGDYRVDDYDVMLFFIYTKWIGVNIEKPNDVDSCKNNFTQNLHNVYADLIDISKDDYYYILNVYIPLVQSLTDITVYKILDSIHQVPSEDMVLIFEKSLFFISQNKGMRNESLIPEELSVFVRDIVGDIKGQKIFNPFAGQASFVKNFSNENTILAQEVNAQTWSIGKMRLIINGSSVDYQLTDSTCNWPKGVFDLILSFPPLKLRLDKDIRDQYENVLDASDLLLKRSIKCLSAKGKSIIFLTHSFLYSNSSSQNKLRAEIIEQDLIETIISFPSGLLSNSNIPFIALIINNDKSQRGFIKMVEASNFTLKKGRKIKLDNQRLIKIMFQEGETEYQRIVSKEEIRANDYNLSLPRYFYESLEFSDGVKLKEILERVALGRVENQTLGKLVKIKDLSNDSFNNILELDKIEERALIGSVHKIEHSCLLLSLRLKDMKPTYFEYKNEPIFIPSVVLQGFKVNNDKVDIDYLVNELSLKYISDQLDSYRTGTHFNIRTSDFLNVVIKLPSIKEQKAKVALQAEISGKIKQLKSERDALAHGVMSKEFENFSTLKHSLGSPLLNIGSSARNIVAALKRNNVDLDTKLNERFDITIGDSFDAITKNLDFIHAVLASNDQQVDFSKYKLEDLDFIKFIRSFIRAKKSSIRKDINLDLFISADTSEFDNSKVKILSDKDLLKMLFEAILENAISHAFVTDQESFNLLIHISFVLEKSGSMIQVDVSNDGKSLPFNFELDKYVRKNSSAGDTGNTGQGGYIVNEIIKVHNKGLSTLELRSEAELNKFSTVVSFTLPVNN